MRGGILSELQNIFESLVKELFNQQPALPVTLTSHQENLFFDWLQAHGFIPLFLFHLPEGQRETHFGTSFCERIRTQAKQEAAWDIETTSNLEDLLAQLDDQKLEHILMKGAAISHRHYPRLGLRPRTDTDLLVPEQHFSHICSILNELGYSRLDTGPGDLVSVARIYSKPGRFNLHHIVDLHSSVTSMHGPYRKAMNYYTISEKAIPLPDLSPNARCMDDGHALIHACVHSAQHFSHLGDRLIWLYDIHLLLKNMDQHDLSRVIDLARHTEVFDLLAHGILRSRYWFRSDIPEEIVEELSNCADKNSSPLLVENLELGIANRVIFNMGEIDGLHNKVRYILQRLFPPPDHLLQTSGYTNPIMIPLLYGQRVFSAMRLAWSKFNESGPN